jgi:hypothetical protein
MAIDSISSVSPIMSQGPMTRMNRPQETTPDARISTAREKGQEAVSSQAAAPSAAVNRAAVSPIANDAEGSLREASAQISRASQAVQSPVDQRTASQAYNAEGGAREEIAKQQQGNGARTLDVLA